MNTQTATLTKDDQIASIVATLKRVIAEDLSLSVDIDDLQDDVALVEEGLALDSIVIVQLIGILEERMGFEFQDTDLRMKSFASIRTLAEVIHKRVDPAAG